MPARAPPPSSASAHPLRMATIPRRTRTFAGRTISLARLLANPTTAAHRRPQRRHQRRTASCMTIAGPSALARLDRDVLAQTGARYVIVSLGTNDIGRTFFPGIRE